jgi:Ca-activated chloride channel family protein
VAALVFASSALTPAQSPPAFRSKVEAVRVDALVTDGKEPLRGLAPADFEILDNGVVQQVDLASFDQLPLNVILVLDVSESVDGDRLQRLRQASRTLLAKLEPGDQAALVTFSQQALLRSPLTGDIASVALELGDGSGSGRTALIDGIFTGMMAGISDPGRSLLMTFSDGVDTASWLTARRLLDAVKRTDAVFYSVAVRTRQKPDLLSDLADASGGRLYQIERSQNIEQAFVEALEEFRVRYLLSYTPRGVTRDGWHKIEVRLKNRRATIRARPGYLAGP